MFKLYILLKSAEESLIDYSSDGLNLSETSSVQYVCKHVRSFAIQVQQKINGIKVKKKILKIGNKFKISGSLQLR